MTGNALLPIEFQDLEPFALRWATGGRDERYQRRLTSTMEELQVFYDAIYSRAEAALAYLEQFAPDELPESATNLARMLSSLSLVSFAVEIFKQPKIPDSGATYVAWVAELEPIP